MANESKGINLLPTLTKRELQQRRKKGRIILGTAGVTALVAAVTAGLLFYNLFLQYKVEGSPFDFINIPGLEGEIEEVNNKIDNNQSVLSVYSELGKKTEFISEILEEQPDYEQTLDRIQALLPEDMVAVSYEINEDAEITIGGGSKDYYTLALFISRSQKEDMSEGYFDKFSLRSARTVREDRVEFAMNAVAVLPDGKSTAEELALNL